MLEGHKEQVRSMGLVKSGARMLPISVSSDGEVRVWEKGREILIYASGHTDEVHGVLAMGDRIITVGEDGEVRIHSVIYG